MDQIHIRATLVEPDRPTLTITGLRDIPPHSKYFTADAWDEEDKRQVCRAVARALEASPEFKDVKLYKTTDSTTPIEFRKD